MHALITQLELILLEINGRRSQKSARRMSYLCSSTWHIRGSRLAMSTVMLLRSGELL
ncbi:hypothetical protein ANCCAN_30104 [Ancylostoma caninum]|uniref:Uncharacterized protein n=1 Tax=Ancylostoma caninum TaxID=29170 RepID=A0A368EZU4_ANCCA|nr:hypothetical protein ANCCAN_30104 [Ancylostoma caninum]